MALPPQFLKKKEDNKKQNEALGLHSAHAKGKAPAKAKDKKAFLQQLAAKKGK